MVSGTLPSERDPGTLTFVKSQAESLVPLGVEVSYLEVTGAKRVKYLRAVPRIRWACAGVDLVHAHHGFCGIAARLQRRVPLVISYMGDELLLEVGFDGAPKPLSRFWHAVHRLTARTADAVIVKSDEMASRLSPRTAHVHVVPNGVDFTRFQPIPRDEAIARLGLDPRRRYLLFPANPQTPYKGFAFAREAVERLNARLAEPVELLTLQRVAPSRVPWMMCAADAVVLTSFWEGSPNVIKESMACCRPIVATDVGDIRKVIGRTAGCHVTSRDPEEVCMHLETILREPVGRTTGREDIRHLELRRVAERIVDIYAEVLERHGGHGGTDARHEAAAARRRG